MVSDLDQYLFHQGTHYNAYHFMGAHYDEQKKSTTFTVWAPHARNVSVAADSNNWSGNDMPLTRVENSGLFTGTYALKPGMHYKYAIETENEVILKADPYQQYGERRPLTASIIYDSKYRWKDASWQRKKKKYNPYRSPINIYELHLGTWMKHELEMTEDMDIDTYTDKTYLSYKEMADKIVPYVKEMNYTHIELMPITEHPFDLSWGYQVTGYFSPTSRFGEPDDFKYFVDLCHQNNIGVILDWVPAHFCKDAHGLRMFDGTPIYEYQDTVKAEKRNWGTLTFDFGRTEVQSFLISSALYWLKEFHIDGLRVDAVHSMTDLNFENHEPHEKIFNPDGSTEHREAIAFIQKLNTVIFDEVPGVLMIAEDSSDMKLVTRPVKDGGLGFNFKWDLGFMHDTLDYLEAPFEERIALHHHLTFPMMYRYDENFILPFSHDEVVHGKKSMLDKMPGDQWQKFAQYRLLYAYQLTQPGKKLNFMGSEIGMYAEWKDKEQIDWFLLKYPIHSALKDYVQALNKLYLKEKPLFELDYDFSGYQSLDADNKHQNVYSYVRRAEDGSELIIILNFSMNVYYDFRIGVPAAGKYREIFNSDLAEYGGSDQKIKGYLFTEPVPLHNCEHSLVTKIPPSACVIYRKVKEKKKVSEKTSKKYTQKKT